MSSLAANIRTTRLGARRLDLGDYLRAGVWLLPLYGLLLALGTLTHQPNFETDFQGYAEYVTTGSFLASHLGASIAGAALGSIGVAAVVLHLSRGPAAGAALAGGALLLAGNVITASVFGAAAFAQPAIGDAHLEGASGMPAFNDAVYGTPLMATAGVGMLVLMAGAVFLGRALRRTAPSLRAPGLAIAIAFPLFILSGPPGLALQPVFAGVVAVAGWFVARRLPSAV